MLLLVVGTVIAIAIASYFLARDIRYPPFLFSLLWAAVLALYYLEPIEIYRIGATTELIILSSVLCFTAGGAVLILGAAVPAAQMSRWTPRDVSLPQRHVLTGLLY